MTSESIMPFPNQKPDSDMQHAYNLINNALIGQPSVNEALVILKKYYDKNNPILDINKPIPGLGSFTPLCMACWIGCTKVVEFLLANNANTNLTIDNLTIPLHLAVSNGHELIVYNLLKAGADVNLASATGQTALMHASENGKVEIVKLLFHKSWNILPDIHKKSVEGSSCIDYASKSGSKDTVRLLEYIRLQNTIQTKSNEPIKRTKI